MRSTLGYAPRRSRRRRLRRRRGIRLILPLIAVLLVISVAYYVFFFPKDVKKVSYPLDYRDKIEAYAAEYQLDPARVASVIYCEFLLPARGGQFRRRPGADADHA